MSNKQRRDGDRRPSDRSDKRDRDDRSDRRDSQPDDDQQRRSNDPNLQESDSLTALKAILGKVAALLTSLKLTQDECTSLVEQLYGSVLDMDLKLAGETDDKRKASILAHINNTKITRSGSKLVVDFPNIDTPKADSSRVGTQTDDTEETDASDAPAQKPAPVSTKAQPAPKPPAESPAKPETEAPAVPPAEPTAEPPAESKPPAKTESVPTATPEKAEGE